jgi:hypothetical protein
MRLHNQRLVDLEAANLLLAEAVEALKVAPDTSARTAAVTDIETANTAIEAAQALSASEYFCSRCFELKEQLDVTIVTTIGYTVKDGLGETTDQQSFAQARTEYICPDCATDQHVVAFLNLDAYDADAIATILGE